MGDKTVRDNISVLDNRLCLLQNTIHMCSLYGIVDINLDLSVDMDKLRLE